MQDQPNQKDRLRERRGHLLSSCMMSRTGSRKKADGVEDGGGRARGTAFSESSLHSCSGGGEEIVTQESKKKKKEKPYWKST